MPKPTVKYDKETAKKTERAYLTPEITRQRRATLNALAPRCGESVLDIGVGPGLLAHDMAPMVGGAGQVIGIDKAPAMIDLARERCAGFAQVAIKRGDANKLDFAERHFDAVVCAQVLLYVAEVEPALLEMRRVLKPGGRAVIVETDWRGLVLSSRYAEITERMIQSWDAAVASPNLPPVLQPMLKAAGFSAVHVAAVPIVVNSCAEGSYAHSMIQQLSSCAVSQGRVTASDARSWEQDLYEKHRDGAFFYCINRFLFTAWRV